MLPSLPGSHPSAEVVRRLDAFEALKNRAALYRDVLQVHVQDLEKTLADLIGCVEHLLNDKAA